jgi:hypothetical protein
MGWRCDLLETLQYATLYVLLCLPLGLAVDKALSGLYPQPDGDDRYVTPGDAARAALAALLQVAASAVGLYCLRRLVERAPLLFGACLSAARRMREPTAELAVALVFVGSQATLMQRLRTLHNSVGRRERA